MMSMEISDGADLLTGRRSGGVVNYWRSRTKMERILLVVMAVMSVALLGFIIGVAVLDGKVKDDDQQIQRLNKELMDCRDHLSTTTPYTTTTTTIPPTTTPTTAASSTSTTDTMSSTTDTMSSTTDTMPSTTDTMSSTTDTMPSTNMSPVDWMMVVD